jgi:hypothetical protein
VLSQGYSVWRVESIQLGPLSTLRLLALSVNICFVEVFALVSPAEDVSNLSCALWPIVALRSFLLH